MNFDCPHCGRVQTVTDTEKSSGSIHFHTSETALGRLGIHGVSVCCANADCRQPTIIVQVKRWNSDQFGVSWVNEEPIVSQRLIPESSAKPQPDYIPEAIREDYLEACRIRDLSPKASATLARRCLQGMIRDFASLKERSLFHEIEKLRELAQAGNLPQGVSEDSIESLHHVRSLGNIGAHMEKDIDVIIPVESAEAQILIDLIETLLDEWYVARNRRQARFAALKATAEQKQAFKELPKPKADEG